jgi:transcriptional regulator with XRE-family HTH domain
MLNFASLVRSRLAALGYGQKDLARAAQVTDSYISQLPSRRKAPPAPDRTDVYKKMERFLQLEPGELGRLAESERAAEIRRRLGQVPEPLFQEFRDLVLRKCIPEMRGEVSAILQRQPFGTLERLVTQTLLELSQRIARRELESEGWIRLAARVGGRSHEEMRVLVLEFLDTDVSQVSNENCSDFIDPLVESWDVDLNTFRLEVRLNPGLVADARRTFAFVEDRWSEATGEDPALTALLEDPRLGGDVTEEEARLLRRLRPSGRRPNRLYYYRALQNLRDLLRFEEE